MKDKHEKIAKEQDYRQLRQQIAYLERMISEKDKSGIQQYNEL
jgi:hypothetical protein